MPPTLPPTAADIAAAAGTRAAEVASAAGPAQVETPVQDTPPAEAPTPEPDLTQGEPILASGAAGPLVRRLADLLAACGYSSNSIITGDNPAGVLDTTVMKDVRAFVAEHKIVESAALEIEGLFVGPETWKTLYKAAAEKLGL